MERKAHYALIGLFTFAVVAGAFGFVFWLHHSSGKKQAVAYRVIFDRTVSGLHVGGNVLFNGIRVGEVTRLTLDPDKPSQVVAMLAVNKATPIRSDTKVGLEFKRRFWEQDELIYGGITSTNLPISQISYPSTGYGASGPFTECQTIRFSVFSSARSGSSSGKRSLCSASSSIKPRSALFGGFI